MRRYVLFLILAVCMALQVPTYAAGTVVVSREQQNVTGVYPYTVAWTSDASGVVSTDATGNTLATIEGRIEQVRIVPGTGGTAPTTLYDVTLIDSRGIDLLNGQGANQSATVGTYYVFLPPVVFTTSTTLDLVVANAGNAKTGTVTVWVAR